MNCLVVVKEPSNVLSGVGRERYDGRIGSF